MLPPESRRPLLMMTPPILAFGIWVMVTGRVGRGPSPIEGTLAIIIGAVFATLAVTIFVIAWAERAKN
jgi:hypothetical protein